MRRPYYVYIGLQDNGSWGGPSATRSRNGILNSDWFGIGGGDGFQTAVDPTDHNIVYTESQDGNTNRYDLRTGRSQSIRPRGPGERGRGGVGGSGRGGTQRRGACRARQAAPGAPRDRQAVTPQQQAAAAGGGRGGAAERGERRTERRVSLQLEHAVHAVAAQPEHRLARRQPAVQVVQPRRHVGRERRISRSRSIATRSR